MYDIYTDGACSGNPGPAGVGVIICKNKKLIAQLCVYIGEKTNNIAELESVRIALNNIPKSSKANIYSDSEYTIGMLSKNWKAKANTALVGDIRELIVCNEFDLTFIKVKGHSKDKGNTAADHLAVRAYMKKDVIL